MLEAAIWLTLISDFLLLPKNIYHGTVYTYYTMIQYEIGCQGGEGSLGPPGADFNVFLTSMFLYLMIRPCSLRKVSA